MIRVKIAVMQTSSNMNEYKKHLKETLAMEKKFYQNYMFPTFSRYVLSYLYREPVRIIWSFQKLLRKSEYYESLHRIRGGIYYRFMYLLYLSRKNRLGEKLGIEIGNSTFQSGLVIYHFGNIVVNGGSNVGKNCHLHGDNCIGNDGKTDICPTIGDNVSLGVGAKVIGNVEIANNIKIAAGAVVVHSFSESNITLGGVPARKLK
jgi:serine O-acetyltransferase